MAIKRNESAFIGIKDPSFLDTLFEHMPDFVQSNASIVHIGKNQRIVRDSYPVEDAFIIVKGELVVVNEFESGKIYEPVVLYENDFLGVVEVVLGQEEYISSVAATTDVVAISISKDVFIKWLKSNSYISYMVLQSVSKNFAINMTDAGDQIVLDSMYLLVNHILKNAVYKEENSIFILHESRDKTATRTGINIRTLYRYIKKLKQLDYIFLQSKRIAFTAAQKKVLLEYSVILRNK